MASGFHPLVDQWFRTQMGEPTEPQRRGWPEIAAGRHTLIAAPTGSGKTLAAFLCCIDRLVRSWYAGDLTNHVKVVYVSPLKALSNDIHRNLETPLAEICELAEQQGLLPPLVETGIRTGDTTPSDRQKMLRRPPHILVTTPESLYLLVTSQKSRETLRRVQTVIVDEIHALAGDKRGSHLALTLERLEQLCDHPPVRIGLSATQRPIDQIASFLVGTRNVRADGAPDCSIVDSGHVRELNLALEVPESELAAVCSHEQWGESYQRLVQLIESHRSTLVFVNTRRLAERIAHRLTELLGDDAVASHHGSLSKQIRMSAEQRLKSGQLKAIVATASLEMGIDIGYIDLVCQIGSPRSIASFLQRVGRSGHSLDVIPKGRLFPLTRDELIECLSLIRAVKQHKLDAIEIPEAPLDILAQQIVAAVAAEDFGEDELFELCRRAWPYRQLPRKSFDEILGILSSGIAPGSRRGRYLHRDAIHRQLRPRRGARLAAVTNGGAIPETAEYRVVTEGEETLVGKVDEDFAIETLAGDVFLLGNTSWRVQYVRQGKVVVQDAQGAPPSIPFWFGEAPGRTVELSDEITRLREEIDQRLETSESDESLQKWLVADCGATTWAAQQAIDYVRVQKRALGVVPTGKQIVFERFFDESGGMQLVIHAPLGARINRAWGLTLRKRFCRSFDFELQAAATDNAILLSIGPQHSFPIEQLFTMIGTHNARELIEQALLASPIFQTRWRWNATRALAVLRMQGGKKVPPHLQRFRSDDLLSMVFPQSTGCLENHHGNVPIPDHPLVRQTVYDGLHEAMDLPGWLRTLDGIGSGSITLTPCDTREPSPFCHEILNANPYAFLDDAPLEERRTRAVAVRRGLPPEAMDDLARLDPDAIAQVTDEAWPLVRDEEELHDALHSLVLATGVETAEWSPWLDRLVSAGRAAAIHRNDAQPLWIAAENWPLAKALYPSCTCVPPVELPEHLLREFERSEASVQLVRGRMQHSGPTRAADLASQFDLELPMVDAALEALEGQGVVLRGRFLNTSRIPEPEARSPKPPSRIPDLESRNHDTSGLSDEWCDRRLLARIHRLTISGLRQKIQPVTPEDYMRFLVRFHRMDADHKWGGLNGTREVVVRLQGFEAPAGAWESQLIASRLQDYDPQCLDHLFMSGEMTWGRLRPPRRDELTGPSMSMLTRTVPITLGLRESVNWLLPPDRPSEANCRSNARLVLQTLTEKGALFFAQLQADTDLLASHLEEALRELAALGLVTSDSFAAIRAIVDPVGRRASSKRRGRTARAPAGRWSLFPGPISTVERDKYVEQWCRLLLSRYGILFRELLTRESAAPPWHELVTLLRRLEWRGELRGGRFVAGVAGEQFAIEHSIELLRTVRDESPDDPKRKRWIVISAADPLNLVGIVTPGKRVTASHKAAIVLQAGRCVGVKQAGAVDCDDSLAIEQRSEMEHALRIC